MTESSWIHIGLHGDYHWLEVEGDVYFGHILQAFPELIFGKYLAITACDSGVYRITGDEAESGWSTRNGITYSPQINEGSQLRFQLDGERVPGYDEWYIFDHAPDFGEIHTGDPFLDPPQRPKVFRFVNFLAFRVNTENPNTDFVREWFWQQIEWMQPTAYIADGRDCLILVTKDADLIGRVVEYLYDIAS